MGFTIGGMRRSGRRSPVGMAVAEYTGLWGWDVMPGAIIRRALGQARPGCSCGGADCRAPGDHPLDPGLVIPAGTPLEAALDAWADVWAHTPGATMLLPTGRCFDVIDVPAAAGRSALLRLERMGLPLGPVARAPHGRAWFLVAPGAAAALPELLYRTGWDGAALDLRGLGPGGHITAPPSDHAGHGAVRWLRPPDLETAAAPPQARLLLGTLAYVCHRVAHGVTG
jgi:hypothetical protein